LNENEDDEIKIENNKIKYGFAQTKSNVFSRLNVTIIFSYFKKEIY
jgi:hypothetical protein